MSYAEEYARELIEKTYSEGMAFPTVLFVIAILVAISSVACFVLAPFYSKGRNKGAKTAGRIISIFDFIIGILLLVAFMVIAVIIAMISAGDLSGLPNYFKNMLVGLVYAPMRFGMEVKSTYNNPCDASLAFYALYFVTAGILGIVAFIVSCISVKKFKIANGMVIRGAAAPAGAPQYNPYQPYGQGNQPYGNNVQNAQPTQPAYTNNAQNAQQPYGSYGEYPRNTYGVYGQNTAQPSVQPQSTMQSSVQPQSTMQSNVQPQSPVQTASPSFCNNCGQQLQPGTKFCPKCGNKLM